MRILAPLLLALALLGCGGDDDGGDPGDGAGDDGGGPELDASASCGRVGVDCEVGSDECGELLTCYDTGFCAPERTTCGGFAGAECMQASHECLYMAGADVGACVTEDEKECICIRNKEKVEGCE
jgi:hypothetical protein